MAAATDTNEITIDPARCIYVKKDDSTSEIYFSNYYLNTLFKEGFDSVNPITIQFISNKDFMNVEIIPEEDKELMATAKEKIPDTFTSNTLKINKKDLDILEYSKITYTHAAAPADGGAAPDGTAVLNPSISEDEILETLSQPIEISGKEEIIFINKAQLRQYLKYNGLWYLMPPEKYAFKDRKRNGEEKKEEEAVAAGGGKKTTTRRRGKAGYNKHRKSNRRR